MAQCAEEQGPGAAGGSPQVDDRAKASEFLVQHDAAVAGGRPVHRVTAFLAGSGPGTHGEAFRAWASGAAAMDARLRREVTAYQLCMLDDTVQEAVHRDVTHVSMRAPASRLAFRAATLRLDQNLAVWSACQSQTEREAAFQCWRNILRCRGVKRKASVPASAFLDHVYRARDVGLKDWGPLERFMHQHAQPVRGQLSAAARLKVDYLKRVVVAGSVYSVPVSDAPVRQDRPLAEAARAAEASAARFEYFEVLSTNVVQRRLVPSAFAQSLRAMTWPVSVQPFAAWRQGPVSDEATQDVVEEGFPVTQDALHLATWPVLRCALRRWDSMVTADVEGCHALGNSASVADTAWDVLASDTPAVVVLERLVDEGWSRATRPTPPHVPGGVKEFFAADLVRRKPYLQCLLARERLFGAGLRSLPAQEMAGYYRCVLAASDPASVPCGQHAQAYSDRLARLCDAQPHGQGVQRALANAPADADADDVFVVGGLGAERVGGGVAAASARARADQAPRTVEAIVEEVCWGLVPVGESGGAGGRGQGGSEPSAQPSAANEEHIVLAGGPVSHATSRAPVREVEGRPVFLEENAGNSGYYRRYLVRCPLASGAHAEGSARCVKKRGTGFAQTRRFGQLEPVAFLGVWLRAASEFGTRAQHMAFVPPEASVEQYMREQGWL
ncbi:MAG: hypothetical protein GY772_19890 [bacterium]|nr:hypothetical protein [bacterium]